MDLRDYLTMLTRRWVLVVSIVILTAAAGVGATLLIPPTYQAESQLFVSTQVDSNDLNQQLLQGGTFSVDRVKSYTQLAQTPKVLDPVISSLGLSTTTGRLAREISANAPQDTVLIDIMVTDGSPIVAAGLANAVGEELGRVIEELEAPTDGGASPVKASVVNEATVPDSPVWPSLPINLAIGLLGGLVLGVGSAALRDSLDNSIKDPDDLARATDMPVLATVVRDATSIKSPIARGDAHSSRSEAYRQLRTNLQFASVDAKPRTIVVTSALAAEGKSSIAGNLAVSLSQIGLNVCLVDGDLRRPSVADYFGLVGEAGFTSVVIGRASMAEVFQPVAAGLTIIASGPIPPNPSELLASGRTALLLKELSGQFDMVIIDAPPTLPVADAAVLAAAADGVLFVVRAGRTTRHQVEYALSNLEQVRARVLGVVLNMAEPKGRRSNYQTYGYTYRPDEARKRPSETPTDIEPTQVNLYKPPETPEATDKLPAVQVDVGRGVKTVKQARTAQWTPSPLVRSAPLCNNGAGPEPHFQARQENISRRGDKSHG